MRSARVRRTVPRRRRTTVRRQAFGNFASAMQQRDSTNVVINAQEQVTMFVPSGSKEATILRNINAMLTTSPMFFNYATMYDQYKLNAVRVGVEMTYIGNQLLNSATFPSICSAWDRNGVRPRDVVVNPSAEQGQQYRGFVLPIYDTVASYSSANEKTIYYGSRWGVVRQLDASSMLEKSVYIATVNTKDVLTNDNLYQCWSPVFIMSLKCPRPVSEISTVIFQLHYQFDVTLRGLRKIVVSDVNTFKQEMTPNANFIGYKADNGGCIVPNAIGNGWVTVPLAAGGAGDAAAANTPTLNPNLNVAGDANAGIYFPSAGHASDNLKI